MESRPCLATATHEPIDLPEQVLTMIVRLVCDKTPGSAGMQYACAMRGLGSVSVPWRRLVKGILTGD